MLHAHKARQTNRFSDEAPEKAQHAPQDASRLVLIGRGLDHAQIERTLHAALARG